MDTRESGGLAMNSINGFRAGVKNTITDRSGKHHDLRVETRVIFPRPEDVDLPPDLYRSAISSLVVEILPTAMVELEERIPDERGEASG